MLTSFSELHPAKVRTPEPSVSNSTAAGMFIALRFLHSEKADAPRDTSVAGSTMSVSPVQPENAKLPMVLTPGGMVSALSSQQSAKA